MMVRFLRGLERLFPQIQAPVLQWDLNLVLSRPTGPPSEPLGSCFFSHLSWKVTFLVAVTSARRVSEIKALTSEPLYTVFYKDKVQLRPHPAFLLKVVSSFHMNQYIFLQVFCAKLHKTSEERRRHSLDVQRALAFYLEHTKPFCKSIQLFIATADKMKGHPVSSQRISNWITSWIRTPCNTSRRTLVTEKHFPASEAHPPKGLMVGSDSDHVPRNIYQTHGY
ncbi:uncharacterized protein LOC116833646 isoform X1 [Chelonoidis abingdonii]|uniref:uncharacterized protein LOC116833646 isoform X1 n=1 Tax=Chelonoidis abingdonii TaxID=106734 RepID=UPI0013F224A8|nr:uncharacterized protein LOC116833646 isoform X1 [Chelonoidis abingdonii]